MFGYNRFQKTDGAWKMELFKFLSFISGGKWSIYWNIVVWDQFVIRIEFYLICLAVFFLGIFVLMPLLVLNLRWFLSVYLFLICESDNEWITILTEVGVFYTRTIIVPVVVIYREGRQWASHASLLLTWLLNAVKLLSTA